MKAIKVFKTTVICTIFGGVFLLVLATMTASFILQRFGISNRFISFLTAHVTIQSTVTEDYWSQRYPYDENEAFLDKYIQKVNNAEQIIESYCTVSLPGRESLKLRGSGYRKSELHHKQAIMWWLQKIKYRHST